MDRYIDEEDWRLHQTLAEMGTIWDGLYRRRYWVDTPQHHFVFSTPRTEMRRKALCWAAIMHKTGLREMESDPGVVPVEVAALGQAYIAAYLYSAHNYDLSEIAEELDITEQSVSQYLTDVGKLRR